MRTFSHKLSCIVASLISCLATGAEATRASLESQFSRTVQPFLKTYCYDCHGNDDPEAQMDLSVYKTMGALVRDGQRWSQLLERLEAGEMPPKKAELHPSSAESRQAVQWFRAVRDFEIRRNAGDPGLVLARRLSNSEYNYSVRDLTGVDIRPTREFPIDPANTAGFDNSGESLTMSPTLVKKYIDGAREVASHMYLREHGIGFAQHPVVADADREKLGTMQIINLYHAQDTDYADYFFAAWQFKQRAVLGQPKATLADIALDNRVSAKYLATIWNALESKEDVGPMVKLHTLWRALPSSAAASVRADCEAMRDYVIAVRKKVETRFLNISAGTIGTAWQPFLIWKNVQYATHRRDFDPRELQVDGEVLIRTDGILEAEWDNQFGPGKTLLVENEPGDPDLHVPEGERPRYEAAWGRFCRIFPDMFYKESRGRQYFNTGRDEGRYLSAGFHNVMGYFRDDQALYELILDEKQQARLDEMWRELDFVASVNIRTYLQFAMLGTRGTRDDFKDGEPQVRSNDENDIITEPSIRKLETDYLKFVGDQGSATALTSIRDFFDMYSKGIAWVREARKQAEPEHLQALLDFAARAYRRPLTKADGDDILNFYRMTREKNAGDHELAVREAIVVILLSPEFSYRVDLIEGDRGIQPVSDYDLASRLSYFLWSSLPDAELLRHAAARDLHNPKVIAAQAKRMIRDPKARSLAIEFGANWLGIRDFEGIGTVDHDRFPMFTPDLRQAMYEEPLRFMLDVFRTNRSLLDFLYADYTFVNAELAKHYGMPFVPPPVRHEWERVEWIKMEHAGDYSRGGLLPMAAFLTKNAPGLRTSPVKRGYWVVRNILGERIPPPPPAVPELPKDEAKMDLPLRDMLARHRENPSCAGCHARFDAMGLALEAFGPVGESRTKDLAGRPVETKVTFPGGTEGEGMKGVRDYIRAHRQGDFIENFCSKLLTYALGRSPMLSDEPLIAEMQRKLAANGYRFDVVLESIVASRQFLNKRGQEELADAGQ